MSLNHKGESSHRLPKRLYSVTNKRNPTGQIAQKYRRTEKAEKAWQQCQLAKEGDPDESDEELEAGAAVELDLRYVVSRSSKRPIDIFSLIRDHSGDPAIRVSLS